MKPAKWTLALYWTAAGLFVIVMAWWVVFFAMQGDLLAERLSDAGAGLTASQTQAVRDAADRSYRMFVYEGGFLVLLALSGLFLVLRSMRREVLLHRQQRDFLSAVTHELRSPIASARLQVESLSLDRVPEEKRERYLARTLSDLDRLSRTVDQLLVAARASSERVQLAIQSIDLAAFTRGAIERAGGAAGTNARIELVASGAVHVDTDSEALETIVSNLLSNAIKYGGEPPRVRVEVTSTKGVGELEVRDHGPGLPSADTERLFEAFVRGDSEVVKRRPGVGLGLYLVAQLSRAVGGEVVAQNADGGGFCVRLKLPLTRDDSGASDTIAASGGVA